MIQECTSLIYGRGKTTLPKSIREQLNLKDGSIVVYTNNSGVITISNEDELANALKKIVTKATKGKSLVNELLRERKTAAKNE